MCRPEDLLSVYEIEKASFEDPYPLPLFVAFLERYPEGFRIAEISPSSASSKTIAGYSIITPWKQKKGTMVLSSLAVREEFKRLGIGSDLLKDAIEIARKFKMIKDYYPGAARIVLQVAVENVAAKRLYTNFGFFYTKTLEDYYGKDRDGIEMELKL